MANRILIQVAPDKRSASIRITPPTDQETLTAQDLLKCLQQNRIQYGINVQGLKAILQKPLYNQSCIVAQGTSVTKGTPEQLKFYFNIHHKPQPVLKENGKLDYRNLNYIENVKENQLLAEIIPAKSGTVGRNIYNEIQLPPKLPALDIQLGQNTIRKNNKIFSTVAGAPQYKNRQISVLTLVEIFHDIDYSVGNINFFGALIVHGSIQQGFELKIGGNLKVFGQIEESRITVDGDLEVKQGITTQEKGHVTCFGSIETPFIENSKIFCAGNFWVSKAIMHSQIQSLGNVYVGDKTENSGLIVAGKIKAAYQIVAYEIGSKMATNTVVEVGNAVEKLKSNYEKAKVQFLEERIISVTNQLHDFQDEISNLTRKNTQDYEKKAIITNHIDELSIKEDILKRELLNLEDKKQRYRVIEPTIEQEEAKIIVYGVIHPGVQIIINQNRYIVEDTELFNVEFFERNGKIIYNHIE